MKNIRFLTFVLILGALVLSACGAAPATATPDAANSGKMEAMRVAFVGTVDSIAGDQWVISGTTVTVDETVVRDGPFSVGDRVKVEGQVNPDASFTVSRVEAPAPQDTATLTPFPVENANEALDNANTNDANINDDNSNDVNINDDNGNDVNINDDNGNDSNSNDSNINDDNGGGNTNDDSSSSANNNDDSGGGSGKGKGGNDGGGKGGSGKDDKGGDDNGGGGHGSDD